MKARVLQVLVAVLTWSILALALPSSIQRRDLSAIEDDPIDSDPMDQIAEESEIHETVIPMRPPRGSVKFSVSSESIRPVRTRKVTPAPQIDDDIIENKKEQSEKERSLMVVLPYNTRNLSESKIQELYTKKPVTWIINTTTTEAPPPKVQTERTSTTVVVTPTSSVAWQPTSHGPTTPAPPVIRDEVRELLASIGLFPPEPSTTTVVYDQTTSDPQEFLKDAADSMTPEMKKLLGSLGLLNSDSANEIQKPTAEPRNPVYNPVFQHTTPKYTAEIDPSSFTAFKPIPNTKPNEEISSDMKDFLASFGLVDTNNAKKNVVPNNIKPRAKKIHDKVDVNVATPAPNYIPTLHPDSMSREMKEVMHALGFAPNINPDEFKDKSNEPRTFGTTAKPVSKYYNPSSATKLKIENRQDDIEVAEGRYINSASIFSPTASVQNALNSTEDVETLKTLLTTYKLLSKNATTPEELEEQLQTATMYLSKHNLSHLAQEKRPNSDTLDKLLDSPDPLSHEELLLALKEAKNDVYKRQETTTGSPSKSQSDTSLDESLPSTTTKETTTEADDSKPSAQSVDPLISATSGMKSADSNINSDDTTEREEDTTESDTTNNNSASIADLESSFGGSTGDSDTADETLPPARPNGFYFLLDLNTFLNVGEDDKGVNIRFAPRAGNSRNFLPITVP